MEVQYRYFPEGKAESGLVSFNKKTKEFSIVSLPEIDRHKVYALKMVTRIRKNITEDSFENDGIIAWY